MTAESTVQPVAKVLGVTASTLLLHKDENPWQHSQYAALVGNNVYSGLKGPVQDYIFAAHPTAAQKQAALHALPHYNKPELKKLLSVIIEAAISTPNAGDDSRIRHCLVMADAAGMRGNVLAAVQSAIINTQDSLVKQESLKHILATEKKAAAPTILETRQEQLFGQASLAVQPVLYEFAHLMAQCPTDNTYAANFKKLKEAVSHLPTTQCLELGIYMGKYRDALQHAETETNLFDVNTVLALTNWVGRIDKTVPHLPAPTAMAFAVHSPQHTAQQWHHATPEQKKYLACSLKQTDRLSGCVLNAATQALLTPAETKELLATQRAGIHHPNTPLRYHGHGVGMGALTALAHSQYGRDKIDDCLINNGDGSYTVRFLGDATHQAYVVHADDNAPQTVVQAALEQVTPAISSTQEVYALIDRALVGHNATDDAQKQQMIHLLRQHCQHYATGFVASFKSAMQPPKLDAYLGDEHPLNHLFIITAIDWQNGRLEYQNPWDLSVTLYMPLDNFYRGNAVGQYITPELTGPILCTLR